MKDTDRIIIERGLRKATGARPPAIVLGGSVNGLSFVRSLDKRSIPAFMLDSDRLIGTYTRRGEVIILPDPEENADPWLEFFDFVASRLESPGVIFATSDVHGLFLARHAPTVEKSFRFLTPDEQTLESIVNKRLQYTIAEKAGIPIPGTFFPESIEDCERLAGEVPYPCILKSYKSHLGRRKITKKVLVVESERDLVRDYAEVATGGVEFMVQEIIPGEDYTLYGYLAFWDRHAREHSWLTKQKLRQCPPLYGDGSFQQTVEAPEVRAQSCKLLQEFAYKGFVGVEFKYDARDETYRLMEINPRTVSGNQLAISAGVDFPWIGYNYLLEREDDSEPRRRFTPGIRYVNEEWDFKAFLSFRRAGKLTFGEWWRSVRSAEARAIGAPGDNRPLRVILWRFVKAFLRGSKGE
jgi:predicted ATP-grasp superfamily ATP-dependent carboligase